VIGLLTGLTIHTPLYYNVVVVRAEAQSGFVLESRGECQADDPSGNSFWGWFSALVAFHFLFLIVCTWVVYKIKDVPSRFNEGKYIAFSLANHFQVTLLAMLLTFFINDKPDRVLLIKSIAILGSSNITLTLMFAPKIATAHELVSRHSEFSNAVKISEEAKSHRSGPGQGPRVPKGIPRASSLNSSLNSDDPVPSSPGTKRAAFGSIKGVRLTLQSAIEEESSQATVSALETASVTLEEASKTSIDAVSMVPHAVSLKDVDTATDPASSDSESVADAPCTGGEATSSKRPSLGQSARSDSVALAIPDTGLPV